MQRADGMTVHVAGGKMTNRLWATHSEGPLALSCHLAFI